VILSAFGIGSGIYHLSATRATLVSRVNNLPTTGIALSRKKISVVERRDPTQSDDGHVTKIPRYRQAKTLKVLGATDAHDLRSHGRDLCIVSSYRNKVLRFNPRSGKITGEQALDPLADFDHWHPNDLCEIEGDLWVSCFADPKEGRNWHDQRDGRGFLFNLTTGERLGRFTFPHSPTPRPEGIYVCDSGTSSIVVINRQGDELCRKELSGFTRGLLVEGDYVIVGVSTHRLQAKTTESKTSSRVHVLRRSDLVELSVIDIPATEIYSIRLVSAWQLRRLRRLRA
jgi:hypothetical protein